MRTAKSPAARSAAAKKLGCHRRGQAEEDVVRTVRPSQLSYADALRREAQPRDQSACTSREVQAFPLRPVLRV